MPTPANTPLLEDRPAGTTETASLTHIRCAALRSKSPYGVFGEFDEDLLSTLGSTTTFWCLKTMSKAGPDDHFVHRHACNQSRRCFQPPEDEA